MKKILVPVDGSVGSDRAVQYVIGLAREGLELDVHLMNVPISLESAYLRGFLAQELIDDYHRRKADKAFESAAALLDHARVKYRRVVMVGDAAEAIANHAADGFDGIVMGTRGMGSVANLVLGSTAVGVVHLADVPVTLVK